MNIETPRLILVPFDLPLLRAAQAGDRAGVGAMLDAVIPADWPSEGVREYQLPEQIAHLNRQPADLSWLGRLILLPQPRALVGGINLKGPPDARGRVETGYEIAGPFRRKGYASEAVEALCAWCFGQPGVTAVYARTQTANSISQHMLQRLGFSRREVEHHPRLGEMIVWVRPKPPGGEVLLIASTVHRLARGVAMTGSSPACALCGTAGAKAWIGRMATLQSPTGETADAVIVDFNTLPAGMGEEFQVSILFDDVPAEVATEGAVVTLVRPSSPSG
ncbi:MAG: GNAT family N-acetyltransferase [Planctomycetes bacterium]|nr:GNAT family N-acetyltransferase [Planctomycetota bacterium]MCL4729702.1 GNAT family N-acetyltransferase [Planctomycetota bacterium]